jgi:NADH dehydrogenase FAD-containing subunit
VIFFDNLLLATGSEPRRIRSLTATGLQQDGDENARAAQSSGRVTTFRDAADFRRLDAVARRVSSIGVVGGSLLGCELAAALAGARATGDADQQLKVTQLVRGEVALCRSICVCVCVCVYICECVFIVCFLLFYFVGCDG